MMAEKIQILLVKRKMSKQQLANILGISASNLYQKMRRDNFAEEDLVKIANALNCDLEINFILNDTGEIL